MGRLYRFTCRQCHNQFEHRKGCLMSGYLVHCERCGKEQLLRIDDPSLSFSPLITEEINELLPDCRCGGRFSYNA